MAYQLNYSTESETPTLLTIRIRASSTESDMSLRITLLDHPIYSGSRDSSNYLDPAPNMDTVFTFPAMERLIGTANIPKSPKQTATWNASQRVEAFSPGQSTYTIRIYFNTETTPNEASFSGITRLDRCAIKLVLSGGAGEQRKLYIPWNHWRSASSTRAAKIGVLTFLAEAASTNYFSFAEDYWKGIASGRDRIIPDKRSLEEIIAFLASYPAANGSIRRVNIVAHGGPNDSGPGAHINIRPYKTKLSNAVITVPDYVKFGLFLKESKFKLQYKIKIEAGITDPIVDGRAHRIPKDSGDYQIDISETELSDSPNVFSISNSKPSLFAPQPHMTSYTVGTGTPSQCISFKPKAGQVGEAIITIECPIRFPIGSKFHLDAVNTQREFDALNAEFSSSSYSVLDTDLVEESITVETLLYKDLFTSDPLHVASRALKARLQSDPTTFPADCELFLSSCRVGNDSNLVSTIRDLVFGRGITYAPKHRIGYLTKSESFHPAGSAIETHTNTLMVLAGPREENDPNQPYLAEQDPVVPGVATRIATPDIMNPAHFLASR